MFRKLLCSIFVMSVAITMVAAEDFVVIVKKVDGDKVTFSKFAFKKGEKGTKAEDVTLPVSKDAKITKGKFNKEDKKIEAGEALENGLKNEIFTKLDEKKDDKKDPEKKGKGFPGFGGGVFAQITTSDDGKTITAITVMQFGGKKKAEKDK